MDSVEEWVGNVTPVFRLFNIQGHFCRLMKHRPSCPPALLQSLCISLRRCVPRGYTHKDGYMANLILGQVADGSLASQHLRSQDDVRYVRPHRRTALTWLLPGLGTTCPIESSGSRSSVGP